MIVNIDNREPQILKNHFLQSNHLTSINNLDLGDIIIKTDNLELIIERKEITDLASSIRDGRLREQKIRLIRNYNKKNIIYIIEGDITKENSSMKYNKITKYTIYSSIFNMLVRDNINIFMSSSIENTIECIEMLIKKIQKKTLKIIKYDNQSVNNTQKQEQEQLYNQTIIENMSRPICVNKSKNITPNIVYKSQLSCIPGISYTTAEAIEKIYPNMINLINSLSQLDKENRIKILQNIKSLKSRKIGIKVATNIDNYLFNN